jgi:predicted nuclease of predicted toxin-antitoxin system
MKLLFAHNLSPSLVNRFANLYPNSHHLYLMGLAQENDHVIWEIAKQQDYVIVTKDSDFNELLILKGFPPKVSGQTKLSYYLSEPPYAYTN